MQAKLFILLIWSLGTAMSIPWVVVYGVEMVPDGNGGTKPFCTYVRVPEYYFQIYVCWILVIVQYFLPLTIICFAYIRMGAQLWGSTTPGNAQDLRDATLLKNKKRVSKYIDYMDTKTNYS
jgi:leucokinin receptor